MFTAQTITAERVHGFIRVTEFIIEIQLKDHHFGAPFSSALILFPVQVFSCPINKAKRKKNHHFAHLLLQVCLLLWTDLQFAVTRNTSDFGGSLKNCKKKYVRNSQFTSRVCHWPHPAVLPPWDANAFADVQQTAGAKMWICNLSIDRFRLLLLWSWWAVLKKNPCRKIYFSKHKFFLSVC